MRHGDKIKNLGRTYEHRAALMSNLACQIIEHKRIVTTLAKAKALRVYVEPMITRSKNDTMHNRRIVFSRLSWWISTKSMARILKQQQRRKHAAAAKVVVLKKKQQHLLRHLQLKLKTVHQTLKQQHRKLLQKLNTTVRINKEATHKVASFIIRNYRIAGRCYIYTPFNSINVVLPEIVTLQKRMFCMRSEVPFL
jgi:large subunit ribosomal protein L17